MSDHVYFGLFIMNIFAALITVAGFIIGRYEFVPLSIFLPLECGIAAYSLMKWLD